MAGIIRGRHGTTNIDPLRPRLRLYQGDLLEAGATVAILEETRPDLLFHLAGQAAVPESWRDPATTLVNNILGQLHLLQGVLAVGIKPRILIVGSNEEYGLLRPEELPVRESNPLRPANPYAVSKVAQDFMGYQYFLSHGLDCVRVRPFNHLGPRQGDAYVASSFARQVAEAEVGLREPVLRVGNLEARRDFTDVRDMVRAYYLALLRGEAGEVYNLGSGRDAAISSLLDFFLERSKMPLRVEQDNTRLRPADVPRSVCDFSKFKAATGWEPQIPLEVTLIDVLEYWRKEVALKGGG